MKQSLEKAIESSRKGYIDGYDEIDRIFTGLLEMPMEQFGGVSYNEAIHRIDAMLKCWEITPNEMIRSALTAGDFFGFIQELKDDPIIYTPEETEICLRCYYSYLACLEEQLRYSENNTVKLFMSCSAKSFFMYTWEKPGCVGGEIHFQRFKERVEETMSFSIDGRITIREYLKRLFEFQGKRWRPNQFISEFEKKIRDSYDEFAYFIFDGTEQIYPDMFDVEVLMEKYKHSILEKDNDTDERYKKSAMFLQCCNKACR